MTKPLIYTILVALLLAGGVWWGVTQYKNTNTVNQNTNGLVSSKSTLLGEISSYYDPDDRFIIPLPGRWTGRVEDGTTLLTTSGLELNLRIYKKKSNETLTQYVEANTTKAPVVEGTYQPFQSESLDGMECIQVVGSYVGRFTYNYCSLSDTDVLVLGGAVPTDQQYQLARSVIKGVRRSQ